MKIDNKAKAILVLVAFFGLFIVASIAYASQNITQTKTVSLKERFDILKDNYSLTVTKNLNGNEITMDVMCDESICLYESDSFNYREILKYNNKYYSLSDLDNVNNASLIEVTDEVSPLFNERYYNVEMLKNMILVSSRTENEDETVDVSITLERYLKEYNYVYSEINKTTEEINIPLNIVMGTSFVRTITIDYKDIDKYFNNSSYDTYTYTIKITSINKNDYDYLKEYIDRL